MKTTWRVRIAKAIDEQDRSYREVSLAAGLGPNFVSQMLSSETDPGTQKIARVANALGLSLTYVLSGLEMSAEDEEFLQLISDLSDEERSHFLGLLRSRRGP